MPRKGTSRAPLIAAAMRLLQRNGYEGTTVEAVCEAAGVSKGAFFHSFKSKEEIALAALDAYTAEVTARYTAASSSWPRDPHARLAAYLTTSAQLADAPLLRDGCLLGILTREHTTSRIARSCATAFDRWAGSLVALVGGAAIDLDLDDARFVLSVLQGALILAKATNEPALIRRALARCADAL